MTEKHSSLWEDWLDKAAAGLRGHPDYDQVRQELLDHLEDKTAGLTRIFPDIPREEAQVRALAGMGEGESLSRALAQAHGGLMAYQLSALLLGMALVLVGLEGIIMLWRWILPLAFQGGPL